MLAIDGWLEQGAALRRASTSSDPEGPLLVPWALTGMPLTSLGDVESLLETLSALDRYAVLEGLLHLAGRFGASVLDEQCRDLLGDPAGDCSPAFPILAASTSSRNPVKTNT